MIYHTNNIIIVLAKQVHNIRNKQHIYNLSNFQLFAVYFFSEIHPLLNVKKPQDKSQARKGKMHHGNFFTMPSDEVPEKNYGKNINK